jgi:molybdate transport system substrate-binding protein
MSALTPPAALPVRPPLLLLATLLAAVPARADELRVLAAGATESTLRAEVAGFEARHGHTVKAIYGAVGALRDRLLAGEAADLVIVSPAILEQLEARGMVRTGTRVDLGRVGGGIAVRAGEPLPAIGTPEELRAALLAAEEIYFADPATATAGAHFLSVADRLGVGAEVRRKGRTAAGGKEAMRLMAGSGARAIGLTQVSEILSVKEVVLVGPYPPSLQKATTYSGVIPKASAHPETARALLDYLTSAPVQARFREAGFERAP